MAVMDLPQQPKVPVWVKDEQWQVWHAWPTENRMDRDGWALTACLTNWWWSETTQTSYHVVAAAACPDCNQALRGTLPKRRGRRGSLPAGVPQPKPARPYVEPEPLEGMEHIRRERRAARSRTERLAEVGAKVTSYTRPDGQVVERVHPTKAQRQALLREDTADLDFSIEVGTRLPEWACMQCGAMLAYGSRFCSTWCEREHRRWERESQDERFGLVMARRQFEDQLYGRRRRDDVGSWTPPASQIRKGRWRD